MFGLNFEAQNITLARQQMDAIKAHLPADAVVAFEVGNEVGGPLLDPMTAS